VNEREIRVNVMRSLAGVTKSSFGIRVQADRANPFAMFESLGEIVSACCVVSTGQSAPFKTFAVVDPSNVLRNTPACVGMIMRSNPFVRANSVIWSAALPDSKTLRYSPAGNQT